MKNEDIYIIKMNKTIKQYHNDNEILHAKFDAIILEILKEIGYKKVVELYEKTSDDITFWYA